MTVELEGVRVLVVEDEFLVAVLIEEILQSAGCVVSGPVSRVADALDAIGCNTYDAAVLDVNLAGEPIDQVVDALSRRNVPFLFVTGYSAGSLPVEFAERPRTGKPFKVAELLGTLSNVVHPPSSK